MSDLQRYELDGVDCMAYCYGGSPKISPVDPLCAKYDDGAEDWVKFPDAIAAIKAERARIIEKVEAKRLSDTSLATYEAYNKALDDVLAAIREDG